MVKPVYNYALIFTLAAGVALPAHAGMFEFIDDMFTFREDQKERVAPRRQLPPREVVTPYFRPDQNAAWSGYYTRDDLRSADYLNGSSSKVMRPGESQMTPQEREALYRDRAQQEWLAQEQHQRQYQRQQPQHANPYADEVNSQEYRSQQAPSRAYVGEPGTTPAYPSGQGGVAIGKPHSAFEQRLDRTRPTPRPGDFDYQAAAPVGENEMADISSRYQAAPTNPSLADGKRHMDSADSGVSSGKVSSYKVQSGDTLSHISEKPQIYGDWSLWPLIWDANKGAMKDPDNLRHGQKLGIPRDYSRAEARNARKRANAKSPTDIRFTDGK
ncbi:MAG: LysM peptidoglycan-binding domain-containing protein [Alphaproteobacteria bacterium]